MPEHNPRRERPPINRRNTGIALGAIGAMVVLGSIGNIDFGLPFIGDDMAATAISISDGGSNTLDSLGTSIEEKIETAVETPAGGDTVAIDDTEMNAAVAELRAGKPDRYLSLMEKF